VGYISYISVLMGLLGTMGFRLMKRWVNDSFFVLARVRRQDISMDWASSTGFAIRDSAPLSRSVSSLACGLAFSDSSLLPSSFVYRGMVLRLVWIDRIVSRASTRRRFCPRLSLLDTDARSCASAPLIYAATDRSFFLYRDTWPYLTIFASSCLSLPIPIYTCLCLPVVACRLTFDSFVFARRVSLAFRELFAALLAGVSSFFFIVLKWL
jgi:hypothetical protein